MTLPEAQAIASKPYPKNCEPEQAMQFARYLGRAMPTGAGTDLEIWLKDAAIVFSEYAEHDVRMAVESPTKGFRSKHQWLPVPKDMIEFLGAMRERRGRIIANALHVIEEHQKEPEPQVDPEERAASIRRVENLIREWHGQPSVEQDQERRAAQAAFNAEAIEAGDGDYQRGIEIMLGVKPEGDSSTWRITIPEGM